MLSLEKVESFEVQLPLFEGPFDLLLFFIERDELNIHDIPIAKITEDFLSYIHQLKTLNIEVAGEFIVVASTLMRIKSRMLLPRPMVNDQGHEVDPREELVKHVIEYKKYKSVVSTFQELEETEWVKERRGNLIKELRTLAEDVHVEAELQHVDLYKLLAVYERVTSRYETSKNRPVYSVVLYPYTVQERKTFILEFVKKKSQVAFTDLFESTPSRIILIFDFLIILELLASDQLQIIIGDGYNNFWIMSPPVSPD